MDTTAVTTVEDVVAPVELVTLTRLKDRAGNPVVVLCEPIAETEVLAITQQLPGGVPKITREEKRDPDLSPDMIAQGIVLAGRVIEKGTALRRGDGSWQRPAFWATAPIEGALPATYLSDAERVLLLTACFRVSGFRTEVTEEVTFRDGVEPGGGAGVRAVGADEGGDGPAAPTAGVSNSDGGVAPDAAAREGAAAQA